MKATSKTFMRVPELVRALEPLVDESVNPKDIFRLIGEGEIIPCGYIHRVPVFDIAQLGDIAKLLKPKQASQSQTILRRRQCQIIS